MMLDILGSIAPLTKLQTAFMTVKALLSMTYTSTPKRSSLNGKYRISNS
jgi:hypothetical protein